MRPPSTLPLERLRGALSRASQAAKPAACGRFLILTHRGPDPDALGACEGLRQLLRDAYGYEPVVATVGTIHRAENQAMVRTLELESEPYDEVDRSGFAGVLLVDTQPEFGHTVVPDDLPIVAVFDHHVPPENNGDSPEVGYRDVRLEAGATCSILWEYLRDAGVELEVKTAGALFCGVRYDTADLSRNATPLDEEAYTECFRRADRGKVASIDHPPLPPAYFAELHRALSMSRRHGPLVLTLMGKVDNPESVAEMADFFLRMTGCSWVLAGAAFESEYVLSLRTDYNFGKAYPLMRRVLDGLGSFGGHGHIAGGRIPLEDDGESTVKSVERILRSNALDVIGAGSEDGIPEEGKPLTE
jgi:nanoRNase/pAp phosphatase (c-di-AMP/oligoRNAs hydrolase)